MSSMNHSDEPVECPLCLEALELDDLKFFPCTCGYQVCRFCWHRIRTDENGLCPACRKAYSENPADFKPLTQEELQHIKQEKKQKDLMKKQKITENRKHLANVRVVQKNLVFVVGLSSRIAEVEILKKTDYFGRFGKIHKVVINHTTAYAGSQGPSASAYVTYQRAEDALKAIQAVNNVHIDGRTLKASLGTTKYCSHFMKNQPCPKPDCMYLHELGDESASFTKEEMQQGKHQELEKKLQDQYMMNMANQEKQNGVCNSAVGSTNSLCEIPQTVQPSSFPSKKTTKDLDPIIDTIEDSISSSSKDSWPALGALTPKDTNKRSRSKGDRNGSARQTPTEENNKRNKEKKNGKSHSTEDRNNSASGSQDSGNSSASATPPPSQLTDSFHTDSPLNRLKSSSPVPVNNKSSSPIGFDGDVMLASPAGTTPSSLSSCSEPSSSLNLHTTPSKASEDPSHNHYRVKEEEHEQIDLNDIVHKSMKPNQNEADIHDCPETFSSDYAAWRDKIPEDNSNAAFIPTQLDDELGFDIFEERTKALSEDIRVEKKLMEQHMQHQYQQQCREQLQKQIAQQQQHASMSQAQNSRGFLESKDTRLPPPGFNGMSHGYTLSSSQPAMSKLMQPFLHQLNNDTSATHPLNGYLGSKLSVPPGLSNTMMTMPNHHNGLPNNSSHHMNNPLINYDTMFSGVHLPNQAVSKANDVFGIKEAEARLDSMRNLSINVMNSANTLNSLGGPAQNYQTSQNNALSNFFNVQQQQQHQQQQQQTHMHPFSSQHNLLHLGNAPSLPKGWPQSNGTDLTAIDPAIVSSGQLTDSRTDSPPMWLRNGDGLSSVDWNMPYGIHSQGGMMPNNSQRGSMWAPTSPPPGFNTISPLHAKQREHKLENL